MIFQTLRNDTLAFYQTRGIIQQSTSLKNFTQQILPFARSFVKQRPIQYQALDQHSKKEEKTAWIQTALKTAAFFAVFVSTVIIGAIARFLFQKAPPSVSTRPPPPRSHPSPLREALSPPAAPKKNESPISSGENPIPQTTEEPAITAEIAPLEITPAAEPVQQIELTSTDSGLQKIALKLLPSLRAIIKEPSLFLQYKDQIKNHLTRAWKKQLSLCIAFQKKNSEVQGDKVLMKEWCSERAPKYIAPFSREYQHLFQKLEPLLDAKNIKNWNLLYPRCCKLLETLDLAALIETPIPEIPIAQPANNSINQMLEGIIPFLRSFVNEARYDLVLALQWLEQQKDSPKYLYPFFFCRDLAIKVELFPSAVKSEILTDWLELYQETQKILSGSPSAAVLDEIHPEVLKFLNA